jgi:hypothetical protein
MTSFGSDRYLLPGWLRAWAATGVAVVIGSPSLLGSLPSYTLDWNAVAWTAGATSTTYTGIQSANLNVTVAVTGSYFVAGFPDDTRNFTGGIANQDSLEITVDYPDRVQFTTVTLTFSQTIYSLTFSLFDIDAVSSGSGAPTRPIDLVDGFTTNGTATLHVTPGTTNSWDGSRILGNAPAADNSAAGNALIQFTGNFTQISFRFGTGSNSNSSSDPLQQSIALGNLNIVPIPEPSQVLPLAVLFIGFAALQSRRRITCWLTRNRG